MDRPGGQMTGDVATGDQKIAWATAHMPVLAEIRSRFEREKPLAGVKLAGLLHIEPKTAVFALVLRAGGADLRLAAADLLSTDNDTVAALNAAGIPTLAQKGESIRDYHQNLAELVRFDPDVLLDDGGDLIAFAHETLPGRGRILGCTEQTTSGVTRLEALVARGELRFPALDVNDAQTKHLFDNRIGCGLSTLDGLFATTNLLIAGSVCVVAGFGWVGKGVAPRLRSLGAEVILTEINPIRALEARLDGFQVMPMIDAAPRADFLVTTTGSESVVREEHFKVLRDGCVIGNMGHFDAEISKIELYRLAARRRVVRPQVEEITFEDGRRVYLLSEGRLLNLAAAQGHPVEIMDLSFSTHALAVEYILRHQNDLPVAIHDIPREIALAVAGEALHGLDVRIDGIHPPDP